MDRAVWKEPVGIRERLFDVTLIYCNLFSSTNMLDLINVHKKFFLRPEITRFEEMLIYNLTFCSRFNYLSYNHAATTK